MTENERYELEKAARLLDNWLHCGKTDKPRQALLDAMNTAVHVMQRKQEAKMYERTCAVLNYHIVRPMAELFRDPVTIGAVKTAIAVLDGMLNRQE